MSDIVRRIHLLSKNYPRLAETYGPSLPVKIDGSSRVVSGFAALPSSWGFDFTFGVLGLPSSPRSYKRGTHTQTGSGNGKSQSNRGQVSGGWGETPDRAASWLLESPAISGSGLPTKTLINASALLLARRGGKPAAFCQIKYIKTFQYADFSLLVVFIRTIFVQRCRRCILSRKFCHRRITFECHI